MTYPEAIKASKKASKEAADYCSRCLGSGVIEFFIAGKVGNVFMPCICLGRE